MPKTWTGTGTQVSETDAAVTVGNFWPPSGRFLTVFLTVSTDLIVGAFGVNKAILYRYVVSDGSEVQKTLITFRCGFNIG